MIAVIKNFQEVIETRNIDKMNKELYEFLNLYCGFIAHYDINGFKATYKSPRDFAEVFIRHFDREHPYYSGIYCLPPRTLQRHRINQSRNQKRI